MIPWLVGLALGGAAGTAFGVWWSRRAPDRAVVVVNGAPLPDRKWRVLQDTPSGARARQMFERGIPGTGEVIELWGDGMRRGQKEGPNPPSAV